MKTRNGHLLTRTTSPHFPSFLDSVPALIAYVNRDLCYEYANAAYAKWTGELPRQIVGKKVYDVLEPEIFEILKPHIKNALSGSLVDFEYVSRSKKGVNLFDVSYTPDLDNQKGVKGYTILINDVTDKRKTEREFIDYAENAAIGLHWVNAEGIIVWANNAELELLGYSRDEYVGHHISQFHADQTAISDIFKRLSCNETLSQYEAVLKCKNGSLRHVLINSNVLWEDGKFIHTRCFTTDITDKKVTETKLKASQADYEQLLQVLPIAVYTCDEKGYIRLYNNAATELWGREPQLGKDLWCGSWRIFKNNGDIVALQDCPMAVALKEAREVYGEELVVERPDGTRRFIKPYPKPIFDNEGNVVGAVNAIVDITERREAELALKESEVLYKQLVNSLPVPIYTCDNEGRITLYNKAAADLWGREPQIGKDLWCGSWKIYKPDGSPLPLDSCPMAVTLKERRPVFGEEIIVQRPDGERRHVAPNPHPLYNDAGKIIGAVNLLVDITDQKRATLALAESEERFRTLANNVPIVVWMFNEHGDMEYVNPTWSLITGEPTEKAVGFGWLDFLHPDDRPTVSNDLMDAVSGEKIYESKFRYRTLDNDYIIARFHGRPRYSPNGKFLGFIGTLQDVTLHENAKLALEKEIKRRTHDLLVKNEELKKSEERYYRMVAEVQDYAIILLSPDGVIQNWNIGAEKIKGYKAEEAVGQSFKLFYQGEDLKNKVPDKLLKEAEGHGRASYEGWRVRKDGSTFWGNVVLTALHDDDHTLIGFSKVTRDLTERKLAEDAQNGTELRLREKNRQLEKMNEELAAFAHVSSHDLQEPLRKIQTFSTRLVEIENFSDAGKDYLDRIQKAAKRMRSLIEDLLEYSRANTSERKLALTDLNQIVIEAKADLREAIEAKNADIMVSKLPTLNVIPFQFQQLIVNILGNALKFAKPDVAPAIHIRADIVKGEEIKNPLVVSENYYHHISVTDNGIGFDQAYAIKIFEIFQRLHNRNEFDGTGVGLAICKKIVENHHGFISAEARVNKGATFHIYIPA